MGDPRKLRKKYSKPSHPWQKLRIEEEKKLMQEYGFKNKSEIWKLNSKLRKFKSQVKALIPKNDDSSKQQKEMLLTKLKRLNLLKENAIPEDILAITLKDLCERRLQTIVYKKGLARTIKQARQFIVHEHIVIGDKKITSPNYIVNVDEENQIRFAENSPLNSEDHPERIPVANQLEKEKEKVNKSKEEIQQGTEEAIKAETKVVEKTQEVIAS